MLKFLQKWFNRLIAELINAKLGLVAFAINFVIVFWVNIGAGSASEAVWAGIRGGVSAFLLGGIFGRMSERFSELSNPWLAYPLGSVIPTLMAYTIIWPMHSLTGTPRPFMSTLLPMLQSMFINTPSTIFVLRRGFLRQNSRKPAVKDKIWLKRQERKIEEAQQKGKISERKIALVVPTYWVQSEQQLDLDQHQFDHPTPIAEQGTLAALLKSMQDVVLNEVELIVVLSADCEDTENAARKRIAEMFEQNAISIPCHLFDSASLSRLNELLGEKQNDRLLNLTSYAGVRNCGLVAPVCCEASIISFIDDDELFIEPDFFSSVRRTLRLEFNNNPIDLLAGYYLYDSDGKFERKDTHSALADVWPKYQSMNRAFRHYIGRDPRYKAAPFGFGGNLHIRDTLARELHFDPCLPRGEDVDYVLMARRLGKSAVFDTELAMLHKPPQNGAHLLQQVYQDMVRFTIQREKLRMSGGEQLDLHSLRRRHINPYPGPLVSKDLPSIIDSTATSLCAYYKQAGKSEAVEAAEGLTKRIETLPAAEEIASRWQADLIAWRELMNELNESGRENILSDIHA